MADVIDYCASKKLVSSETICSKQDLDYRENYSIFLSPSKLTFAYKKNTHIK